MEDREIVAMLWRREENAINEMQTSYGTFCYGISYQILNNREDAHECVNDTWFQTWKSIPDNRPRSLKAYVAKIIRNLSLNRLIHDKRWKRGKGEAALVYEEMETMVGGEDVIERMIDRETFRQILNSFLHNLDLKERNIFVLRFWYFYSPKQIAEKYKMKEKTVYNILYRLRKDFRNHWEVETIFKKGY